ncbi:neutral/alkaline non-lysosomal ceramidase N-terminal domain-containing protein [Nocardioides cheoyonin]|uniref:neutral/alkaline non-lysosomal ceramidase N-terminal domain-containing protein n=1 Tax=Nocardioides cheoyonin TaxID=3156615 RepID=UPI0032B6253E
MSLTARTVRTGARMLAAPVALVVALGLLLGLPEPAPGVRLASSAAASGARSGWLVGRGIADVTGEAQGVGMMGYADFTQVTDGIHMRQRSRAFVLVDRTTGRRFVHVVADIGMIFGNIRDAVLAKLRQRYGSLYGEQNVMLTATHTHSGVAGFSHDDMYNLMALGAHDQTTQAIVDGIYTSIVRATDDLAPATLSLSQTHLTDANRNRSKTAFDRDPKRDRSYFPGAHDTLSTTLSVRRGGRLVGVINWFPVHGTSMPTTNRLISPDNKGYAEYHWERQVRGVDYLGQTDPAFVASFAQTNAGDMSPNLDLEPGKGPTDDPFTNTRILGTRQYAAAMRSANSSSQETLTGGLDYRLVYVDMAAQTVSGRYTPDGKVHHTCAAKLGAAFAAGSTEDGGGGLPVVHEGKDGGNPEFDATSAALYAASPGLKDCQSPKEIAIPAGALDQVQHTLPVQLVRIGDLYLIGLGQEVTIVSGLRLRRAVAGVLGVPLSHVLVQGYANAYAHYLTTPQEYDSQEYEGASTVFGRYELPAYQQVVTKVATAMKRGTPLPLGDKHIDSAVPTISGVPEKLPVDLPVPGTSYGDVVTAPDASYAPGGTVTVAFSAASPDNDLHDGGTFLAVERKTASGWTRVADDGDWSTKITWDQDTVGTRATITWDIPKGTAAGTYRIRYFGDAKGVAGGLTPITGTSPGFAVV